jgi:hypothetical protein
VNVKSGAALPAALVVVPTVVVVAAVDPDPEPESGTIDVVVEFDPDPEPDVTLVVVVAAVPQEATSTAPASKMALHFIISTVYGRSRFALAGHAHTHEREVCALDFGEAVSGGKLSEHGRHLVEGDVNGSAALLADEVLVITPACEVDDRRSVAEVDVMENVETLEHVECPVHG